MWYFASADVHVVKSIADVETAGGRQPDRTDRNLCANTALIKSNEVHLFTATATLSRPSSRP